MRNRLLRKTLKYPTYQDLKKVKKFIDENKKRPIQDSNSEERTLALWLSSQKTNYTKKKQIMQYQEIRKEWEEFKEEYGTLML